MRKIAIFILAVVACWVCSDWARAQQLNLPGDATAGKGMTLKPSSSGTLYLVGPGQVIKREAHAGQELQIKAEELRSAGRWIAILRSGGHSQSQPFWVKPGDPENISFLARPSRVPVARPKVITGVAFVFDKYQNLVLQPAPVKFSLSVGGSGDSRTVTSRNGVAWIDSSSAKKAGAAQFVAAVGDTNVRRVVQQVASDPCNLRMHVAGRQKDQIVVETDPVHDCTGNPVPDGTIVTFIETDKTGKSVVDARIKKGIARAELPSSDNATISVAAGVVLGNELHVGGGR